MPLSIWKLSKEAHTLGWVWIGCFISAIVAKRARGGEKKRDIEPLFNVLLLYAAGCTIQFGNVAAISALSTYPTMATIRH